MRDMGYYHGSFSLGQKHGEGVEKLGNGDSYKGVWEHDQKQDIHEVYDAKSRKKLQCHFENDVNMGKVRKEAPKQ